MQAWIEARNRHHLSHAQVQMAREPGMKPAKLGKIDNHKQEPWKLPLPYLSKSSTSNGSARLRQSSSVYRGALIDST